MTEHIIEITKILIPIGAIILFVNYIFKQVMAKINSTQRTNVVIQKNMSLQSNKIQACERLALFLERISPDSLMVRVYNPGMTLQMFHKEMLVNIRKEYEHNLSQQLYVSAPTWLLIKRAKEEMSRIINSTISKIDNNDVIDFNNRITSSLMKMEQNPITIAVDALRKELYS